MTRDNIKKRILAYIRNEKTNYAMMISGEWGTGKTYLLQNENGIMEAISKETIPSSDSNNKYRPVYVSLSGISTIERLKELMFAGINLTRPKTKLEFEIAQFKNQSSLNDFKPKSEIPQNIVYCFDDLERVYFPFLEELLGYINSYIEHSGNKVLFICDDTKIKEYFEVESATPQRNFEIIQEKYIRRTLRLDADLDVILDKQGLNERCKKIIRDTFLKGQCNNLRTLQFTIESLREILNEFDIIKKDIDEKYHENLQEFIVFYTTFVSIEYKKGAPYYIIQKVNFPSRVIGFQLDLGYKATMSPQTESNEDPKEIRKEQEKIDEIEHLYFPEKDGFFPNYPQREPFDSIGEYIDSGEFKASKFEIEILKIADSLKKREGTEDEKIRKKIDSIYDVPDSEVTDILNEVLESLKNTSYRKPSTYLSLFNDLLVLESFKINNFCVNKELIKIFINSILKGIDNNNLEKEPFLDEQTSGNWLIDSIQAKKFHRFRDCILKVNDEIDSETDSSVEVIIKAICGSYEDMQASIVDGKENYTLKETDTLPIFEKLKECTPRTIHTFRDALDRRYTLSGGYTQASYERGFINEMLDLVDKHLNLIDKDRPISYIAFYNLKKKIEYWIKTYSLTHE